MPTQEEQAYLASQLQLLQEMFPSACSLEVRHCLAIAGGDAGQAAQLVLHRQEAGQSLTPQHALQAAGFVPTLCLSTMLHANTWATCIREGSGVRQKPIVDDQQLKERIIARYSYIDKEEAKREHRPVAPKSEPKKLIRYRDNKIVSLKGERFTEVKKEDDEDSKKTYVSLKPARQYRLH
ncbi:hypothetical protein B566_EDAN014894 [Ephemera danica]|nr:hypothetical protein B566_EDAN014894 [Ephemera danica]